MIYIVGDTHGQHDAKKLSSKKVLGACEVFPEYTIVCGDYGFVWSNDDSDRGELWWNKWIEQKPYDILFVDGNHENHNRLERLPSVSMFGSVVGQAGKNSFHLRRGHIYEIQGKTFFVMGGALSIDKGSRKNQISWWPQEQPSYADFYLGQENLKKHNNKVDYILSHTAPHSVVENMFEFSNKYDDPTTHMLEAYKEEVEFKHWYFGHFHVDHTWRKYTCLWEKGAIL